MQIISTKVRFNAVTYEQMQILLTKAELNSVKSAKISILFNFKLSSFDWVLLLSIKSAFIHMLWTASQYNLRLFICAEMNLAFVAYVAYVDSSIYVYYIYLQRLIYKQIIVWSVAIMNVIVVLTLDFQRCIEKSRQVFNYVISW